jgi:hypothetical protein
MLAATEKVLKEGLGEPGESIGGPTTILTVLIKSRHYAHFFK